MCRVSFDLDGVLYERVDFFIAMTRALKSAGFQIGVLTGHRHEDGPRVLKRLSSMGYPDFDFYFGRPPEYMHLNGAHRKSDVIRDVGIDLHFDDYDFDHPDTIRLFDALDQEFKIARLRSTQHREWSRK